MLILITNDDSAQAPGIYVLAEIAAKYGEVYVVAPEHPQSGQSAALTVMQPLRIKQLPNHAGAKVYTVSGTPVDCVKMAMHNILPRVPDLVLSGINHGSNAGVNELYSGTMGAVFEGCLQGLPAVGFSLCNHSLSADFEPYRPFVDTIIKDVIDNGLPQDVCLNVNMPKGVTPLGIKKCRSARGRWTDGYERYVDPAGQPFYMLSGRFINLEPEATDTDEYWLAHNYISVVPCSPDRSVRIESV